jgi:hypothetical protein
MYSYPTNGEFVHINKKKSLILLLPMLDKHAHVIVSFLIYVNFHLI